MLRSLVFLCARRSCCRRRSRAPGRRTDDLVEVVGRALSQRPLGTTRWAAGAERAGADDGGAPSGGVERGSRRHPRRAHPLALPGRGQRVRRRPAEEQRVPPGAHPRRCDASTRTRATQPQLDRAPQQIGAPALWQPGLSNAGEGSRSRSSTRGSTSRTRSSARRAMRCRPASRRGSATTRPPR